MSKYLKLASIIFCMFLLSGCLRGDSCTSNSPTGMCSCSGGKCLPISIEEASEISPEFKNYRETLRKEAAAEYAAKAAANNLSDLTAIISNPSTSADQAYAICEPQADLAGESAARNAGSNRGSGEFSCSRIGTTMECSERSRGGGYARGILNSLNRSDARDGARDAVMASCLAQYGWRD